MLEPLYICCRIPQEGASPQKDAFAKRLLAQRSNGSGAMALSRAPRFLRRMKRDLMEILCCPVCKGDLELRIDVEKEEILEGTLFCKNCNHRYEIKDGIPDLLPPDFK